MSSLSTKRLLTYFLLGAAIGVSCIFVDRSDIFLYRVIDGLLIASALPLIIGGFRLSKQVGFFDLFLYAFRKFQKDKPEQKKPENYSDYLSQEKTNTTYKEPLIVGGIYFIISIFMIIAFF